MSMVDHSMSQVHPRGTKAALPDCRHWPQVPLRAWIGASRLCGEERVIGNGLRAPVLTLVLSQLILSHV